MKWPIVFSKIFIPLIDGVIDAVWEESQILLTETVIPSVDFENFKGYVGDWKKRRCSLQKAID